MLPDRPDKLYLGDFISGNNQVGGCKKNSIKLSRKKKKKVVNHS